MRQVRRRITVTTRTSNAVGTTADQESLTDSKTRPAVVRPPNDTLAKLQTAPHTSGDAARPLPRLTRFGGSDLQRA